jgi:hypothetical protein
MSKAKNIAVCLVVGALVFAVYVNNFGLWPRYFDIAWNEEVQLHDGRIMVLHIRRTYERLGLRLERWRGIKRSMEFSFEPHPNSKFIYKFDSGHLVFLDEKNGKWYIGYYADDGYPSSDLGSLHLYPHMAILSADGKIVKPDSWNDIPVEIKEVNIMPPTPNSQGIAKFRDSLLTIETKRKHWKEHPTGAGEHEITRITEQPISRREQMTTPQDYALLAANSYWDIRTQK